MNPKICYCCGGPMVPGSGKLLCASCIHGEQAECDPHPQSEWKEEVQNDDVVLNQALENGHND